MLESIVLETTLLKLGIL